MQEIAEEEIRRQPHPAKILQTFHRTRLPHHFFSLGNGEMIARSRFPVHPKSLGNNLRDPCFLMCRRVRGLSQIKDRENGQGKDVGRSLL
ncbi:hypothetical protein RHECNPAF_2530016 [Rhizobium etli CNPAF512]|nr:hypothetical protein RHECNPAF_2530016 [Rhizobium etli CNPAF512]